MGNLKLFGDALHVVVFMCIPEIRRDVSTNTILVKGEKRREDDRKLGTASHRWNTCMFRKGIDRQSRIWDDELPSFSKYSFGKYNIFFPKNAADQDFSNLSL
jgi:hypothetical protein